MIFDKCLVIGEVCIIANFFNCFQKFGQFILISKPAQLKQTASYTDEDAENEINRGSVDKPKLTKSPFVATFEYGANAKDCWNYYHMMLQMEDCVDCFKVLHPYYDFFFLFDNSCVHNRGQYNGLNVKRMNVIFSGKQPKMHNTLIKEEVGYLGQFKGSLRPGGAQEMVWPVYKDKYFDPEQHGPYQMTPQ